MNRITSCRVNFVGKSFFNIDLRARKEVSNFSNVYAAPEHLGKLSQATRRCPTFKVVRVDFLTFFVFAVIAELDRCLVVLSTGFLRYVRARNSAPCFLVTVLLLLLRVVRLLRERNGSVLLPARLRVTRPFPSPRHLQHFGGQLQRLILSALIQLLQGA
jgi:hypothetical protein